MKKLFSLIFGLASLVSTINPVSATIINVPGGQPTIQAGINAASPGDTVLVQPGRYIENIDFKGKDIVVGSLFLATQDTSYISQTIIDAQQKNTVVVFKSGETAAAELGGLTLTNGKSLGNVTNQGDPGGGIYCKNASPYLHHLIVEGNITDLQGGGMYLEKSNSVIEYCVIRNNRGVIGAGGLELINGNYEIKNCILDSNIGGTTTQSTNSDVNFYKLLFYNNRSSEIVGVSDSYMNIVNCTIPNQSSQFTYALAIASSDVNIINSVFWKNIPQIIITRGETIAHVTIAFSNIKGGKDQIIVHSDSLYYENNNIAADPLFENITNNDYTLSKDSPCINSGTAFYKIGDKVIINLKNNDYYGNSPDMGYSESNYTSTKVKEHIISNLSLSNFPNPFNSSTTIHYSLSKSSNVHLAIYSITGQKVIDLVDKFLPVGNYQTLWNGTDKSGNKISSGIYIVKLDSGIHSLSNRIVYMK
jgi:hypothetical protein